MIIPKILKRLLVIGTAIAATTGAFAEDNILPTAETQLKQATVADGNLIRLQEFFKKAAEGGKLTIGVLGGSITEGAFAPPDKRYHGILLAWLKDRFPKTEFILVNAGIGATGSDYGAMRVERDLLSKKPDLVVLEYAVNDSNTKEYAESYEGVVRQILKSQKHPALILLFMMRNDGANAQEWETKIGKHYGLPMLSYRDALWPEIKSGRLKWAQLSPDKVHPNEMGHGFAGRLICAFLDQAMKISVPTIKDETLPPPLISSRFENCQMYDGKDLAPMVNQGWAFDDKRFAGWKSSTPGNVMEFEIEGESIFLTHWHINGPVGMINVSVDGGKPIKIDAWFDATWGGCRVMTKIATGLKPGKHNVKVTLLDEKNAKSNGHDYKILCLSSTGANSNK